MKETKHAESTNERYMTNPFAPSALLAHSALEAREETRCVGKRVEKIAEESWKGAALIHFAFISRFRAPCADFE